uniref:Uncharacterized protein n=1 Tax=Rhizobium rhizogenes TaxID=359 RepID=A0A7S4ZTB2_RHIRH|nr:hypothetical protein [Rhizobium rhizogenes]QCL09163.1 hypothetical protein pC5.7b_296 [Rhizobium rhizogenes]QCL09799.1 hypothetical protein pC5.8b_309 [Rhizobium rhizogenes]
MVRTGEARIHIFQTDIPTAYNFGKWNLRTQETYKNDSGIPCWITSATAPIPPCTKEYHLPENHAYRIRHNRKRLTFISAAYIKALMEAEFGHFFKG